MGVGTQDDPYTLADRLDVEALYWKWARCGACGEAKRCVPGATFAYSGPDHVSELLCRPCFEAWLRRFEEEAARKTSQTTNHKL